MRSPFHYFFFQAEDGIRDGHVTGVQTCALPISAATSSTADGRWSRCSRSPRNCPGSTCRAAQPRARPRCRRRRSEEHTSELQSRGHLVCRLLLEKKKKHIDTRNTKSR